MSEIQSICFKAIYSVSDMHVARSDAPSLTTRVKGQFDCDVTLGLWEEGSPHKASLKCEVLMRRSVNTKVAAMLLDLADNRLPDDGSRRAELPYRTMSGVWIDEAANIIGKVIIPSDYLPMPLVDVFRQSSRTMRFAAHRLVRLLRWRQGASGRHNPFAGVTLQWSFNEREWHPVHGDISARMSMRQPISTYRDAVADLISLLAANCDEPLGHELLREAEELRSTHRSALVMTAAALETGVKSHASQLAPECAWLLSNPGAPPVEKLLSEFIPELHRTKDVEHSAFPLPTTAADFIRKRIAQRNQIVHGRDVSVSSDDLDDFILLVRDILYVLDACLGHAWARELVSVEFCKLTGWPEPPLRLGGRVVRVRGWQI